MLIRSGRTYYYNLRILLGDNTCSSLTCLPCACASPACASHADRHAQTGHSERSEESRRKERYLWQYVLSFFRRDPSLALRMTTSFLQSGSFAPFSRSGWHRVVILRAKPEGSRRRKNDCSNVSCPISTRDPSLTLRMTTSFLQPGSFASAQGWQRLVATTKKWKVIINIFPPQHI